MALTQLSSYRAIHRSKKRGSNMPPAAENSVSFDKDIKVLFREFDRTSMQKAFDLWSYDDVSTHADAILAQVSAATMPCDKAWPDDQVQTFRRWVDSGKPA